MPIMKALSFRTSTLWLMCFSGGFENKMSTLASVGWDIFDFSSESAKWNSIKLDWKQDLNVLYQVCVFRADRKTRWPPRPLIGRDIFDISSKTAEGNLTELDGKQDLNVLYQVCVFQADWKNKMSALASDCQIHFRLLLWICWTEFHEIWKEARSQCRLQSLVFYGPIGKTRWSPCPLICWEIFNFSFETAEGSTPGNLTGNMISMFS